MIEAGALPVGERKLLGEYETVALPVDGFVRLPQVRSGMNPDLPDLMDSIRTRGLINQIDVARMEPDQLAAYIGFVNRTWGTDVRLADYTPQQQLDGRYYVVVAGHSRCEAVARLQTEDEAGTEYVVVAKVHQVNDPADIIALQLDENIHSKPAQERRALAIVETYLYGLEHGLWEHKADFLRQAQGRFSRRILDEAIGFAQLPLEARDFVFSGQLSYNAAVAIGQATDTIMRYVAARLDYDDLPPISTPEFAAAYRQEVGLMIAHINNGLLNGTAAKKYVGGQVTMMQAYLDGRDRADSPSFDFALVGAAQQREMYLAGLSKEYRAALLQMRQRSVDIVAQALRLHRVLADEGELASVEEELIAEQQRRVQMLGGSLAGVVSYRQLSV